MKITVTPLTLNLRTTFRIAHGADDQRHNMLVRISDGEFEGLGESASVPYYKESPERTAAYIDSVRGLFESNSFNLEDALNNLPDGSRAARASIDLALHDLWGKRIGQPLYHLFGLNPQTLPETSFTVAMDEPALMAERVRESDLPIIKVKLGSLDDEAIVAAIRAASPARLRLDANAGWSREQAADLIPRLAAYDIEFVEQPVPEGDVEGLRWLHSLNLGVPIFADESVKNAKDVASLAGAVDGVVIKLMKTGGLREALRAIHTARALGMKIMLSCMVESSLGVTAAAHLASLCDYADLDGPLLVKNDPFQGVQYDGARMILPDRPGLGVVEK